MLRIKYLSIKSGFERFRHIRLTYKYIKIKIITCKYKNTKFIKQ